MDALTSILTVLTAPIASESAPSSTATKTETGSSLQASTEVNAPRPETVKLKRKESVESVLKDQEKYGFGSNGYCAIQ